jgi:hypothetical protein
MATATYVPIATQTLSTAASSITFSSIPSTYTDLRLVFTGTTATSTYFTFRYNSDSGTNYSDTYLAGQGSAAQSGCFVNQTEITPSKGMGTIPQFYTVDIFSYTGSTYKTSLMTENADNNGSGYVNRHVSLWRSTAAINTINIIAQYGSTNTYAAGTTVTLWGI